LLAESTPTGYWFIQIVVGAIVVGIGARRLGKKPGAVLALTAVSPGLAFLYDGFGLSAR